MNNTFKKGELHFNGIVKYYKLKNTYGNVDFSFNNVNKGSLNDAKDIILLKTRKEEEKRSNQLIKKEQKQRYKKDKAAQSVFINIRKNSITEDIPNETLKNKFIINLKKGSNSIIECVNDFPEFSIKSILLGDENNSVLKTLPIKLKSEKQKSKLSKLKDTSLKKKCTLKKNDKGNKLLFLNHNSNNSSHSLNDSNCEFYGTFKTAYKRDNKNLSEEKCKYKYKYELPTISSLAKVKHLDYADLKFKEAIFSKKNNNILNNLFNVYFGSADFHSDAQQVKIKKKL